MRAMPTVGPSAAAGYQIADDHPAARWLWKKPSVALARE